ncbi:MAG TPA: CHASE3 domain-containing protein, partial [Terriglobales bacterium]
MTPRVRARRVFSLAILLLCLCAAATSASFLYFRAGEHWVTHSQAVRAAVGDLESSLSNAGRARTTYLISGDGGELQEYHRLTLQISEQMRHLRDLTRDNRSQVERCNQWESVIQERLASWESTFAVKEKGGTVDLARLIPPNMELAAKSSAAADSIREKETL